MTIMTTTGNLSRLLPFPWYIHEKKVGTSMYTLWFSYKCYVMYFLAAIISHKKGLQSWSTKGLAVISWHIDSQTKDFILDTHCIHVPLILQQLGTKILCMLKNGRHLNRLSSSSTILLLHQMFGITKSNQKVTEAWFFEHPIEMAKYFRWQYSWPAIVGGHLRLAYSMKCVERKKSKKKNPYSLL